MLMIRDHSAQYAKRSKAHKLALALYGTVTLRDSPGVALGSHTPHKVCAARTASRSMRSRQVSTLVRESQ